MADICTMFHDTNQFPDETKYLLSTTYPTSRRYTQRFDVQHTSYVQQKQVHQYTFYSSAYTTL
jgi:hypothetical protein